MPWEVPLKFVVKNDNPHIPNTVTIRVEVTAKDDAGHIFFTADVPATTTEFVFPVGPGTPVPPGEYALRLAGLSSEGAISNEYSVLLEVQPPIPDVPHLAAMPATRLVAPPT